MRFSLTLSSKGLVFICSFLILHVEKQILCDMVFENHHFPVPKNTKYYKMHMFSQWNDYKTLQKLQKLQKLQTQQLELSSRAEDLGLGAPATEFVIFVCFVIFVMFCNHFIVKTYAFCNILYFWEAKGYVFCEPCQAKSGFGASKLRSCKEKARFFMIVSAKTTIFQFQRIQNITKCLCFHNQAITKHYKNYKITDLLIL